MKSLLVKNFALQDNVRLDEPQLLAVFSWGFPFGLVVSYVSIALHRFIIGFLERSLGQPLIDGVFVLDIQKLDSLAILKLVVKHFGFILNKYKYKLT